MKDLFDARLYRTIAQGAGQTTTDSTRIEIRPYSTTMSYMADFFETEAETSYPLSLIDTDSKDYAATKKFVDDRRKSITMMRQGLANKDFNAPFSMIHPYALVKLAGAYNSPADGITVGDVNLLTDTAGQRRWYEIDGGGNGTRTNYARNPSTATLIEWASKDVKGRTPYSYQDFVFCKYWNRIQNNRMITLRRYPLPVHDNLEDDTFVDGEYKGTMHKSKNPYSPIATAVTYFGEGTENTLSSLLEFKIGYGWEEAQGDIFNVSAPQNDAGQGIIGPGEEGFRGFINKGLKVTSILSGVLDEAAGGNGIGDPLSHAKIPPDAYSSGPYENRIMGPINVINKTWKRKRELVFEHNGLTLKFSYVARPIAHVNSKAVLLDLLSNILLMTSGRGTFFGGLHYYSPASGVALFPWKFQDVSRGLYNGRLFGSNSAFSSIFTKERWGKYGSWGTSLVGDLMKGIVNTANAIVDAITGKGKTSDIFSSKNWEQSRTVSGLWRSVNKAASGVLLQGATIPYLDGMKALLTGDPVGEWHLTIGNPLNPIAMIGNLICDGCDIQFSDELGPDDFPTGFTATISLKHGMGRDRDATESMFNRGCGRIYTLSEDFKTAADNETKVDKYTGKHEAARSAPQTGVMGPTGGGRQILDISDVKIAMQGDEWNGRLKNYTNLGTDLSYLDAPLASPMEIEQLYRLTTWHTGWIL